MCRQEVKLVMQDNQVRLGILVFETKQLVELALLVLEVSCPNPVLVG